MQVLLPRLVCPPVPLSSGWPARAVSGQGGWGPEICMPVACTIVVCYLLCSADPDGRLARAPCPSRWLLLIPWHSRGC